MIIAHYLPDGGWGGGVILRSLLKALSPCYKFNWISTAHLNAISPKTVVEAESINLNFKYLGGHSVFPFLRYLDALLLKRSVKNVINTYQIDALWMVLPIEKELLYFYSFLGKHLQIPIHISIHDDPLLGNNLAFLSTIRQYLTNLFHAASSLDVISDRLSLKYANEFGVNTFVITRTFSSEFKPNESKILNKLNIIMGGYCSLGHEWIERMSMVLENCNKRIKSIFYLFDPKYHSYNFPNIQIMDSLPEPLFDQFLSDMHIGYAADSLSDDELLFAQTSLPTKVITYIGAGLPFVYHGPIDSTTGDLIRKYNVGIIVSNNEPIFLTEAFFEVMNNYEYFRNNCILTRKSFFDADIMRERFLSSFLLHKNQNKS